MKKLLLMFLMLMISSANAAGITPFADVLLWHASQETTSTWASVITAPKANTTQFAVENVPFSWNTGFKLGVLFEPDCFWDTKLYWTYFPTRKSRHMRPGAQAILPEFFSGFLSNDIFLGSHLNWRFIMNTADLEASHKIDVCHGLSVRPSIGIKAGSINQTINADWNAEIVTATEKVRHRYFGVGPSLGINAEWNICGNLNIVGDFKTAFMYGNWHIDDTYKRPAVFLVTTKTTIVTKMKKTKLGTLMFDYFVGLEWTHRCRSQVKFQFGYEAQQWSNQLRMPIFQQLPVHGDLTLQGVTCGLYIDL